MYVKIFPSTKGVVGWQSMAMCEIKLAFREPFNGGSDDVGDTLVDR